LDVRGVRHAQEQVLPQGLGGTIVLLGVGVVVGGISGPAFALFLCSALRLLGISMRFNTS
jgi:hypothetical protein